MENKKFKLIEDNSRPGYHLYETEDGFRFWVRVPTKEELEEYKKAEIGHLPYQKLKTLGLLKGMKTKSFSEMTEEEQKLFTEDDNT